MDWPSRDADLHELSLSEWQEWDQSLGAPKDYLEDLLAAYVSRKRWEWREQAIIALNLQAEAMSAKPGRRAERPHNERVFSPNNGGVNQGPPPLTELAKLGIDMEM